MTLSQNNVVSNAIKRDHWIAIMYQNCAEIKLNYLFVYKILLEQGEKVIKWFLQRKNKPWSAGSDFFSGKGEEHEKIGPVVSSCNPFPSWPSAAKHTYLQFQKASEVKFWTNLNHFFIGFSYTCISLSLVKVITLKIDDIDPSKNPGTSLFQKNWECNLCCCGLMFLLILWVR